MLIILSPLPLLFSSKLSIGLFLVILGATLTYSIVATANNGGVFTSSQRDLKTIPSAKKIDLVGKLSAGKENDDLGLG